MKKLFTVLFCVCCFVGISISQPTELKFKRLNVEDGLSEGTVNCFLQDRKGFIWIGTIYGLNRYDGYKFKVYKHDPEDSTSISSNNIHAIVEDEAGMIWIGTSDGLNRYDPSQDRFVKYVEGSPEKPGLTNKTVTSLIIDQKKRLWVGTAWGLSIYDPEKDHFIQYKPDEPYNNWLSHNWINRLYEDKVGNIWIGTASGLNRVDIEQVPAHFTVYLPDENNPQSISHHDISDMFEDQQGNFWVSTQGGGLNLFDRTHQTFTTYQYQAGDPQSLSKNSINKIFEDRQGRFWIGTDGGGLNLMDRSTGKFAHFKHNAENLGSIGNNDVRAIFEDIQGNLWVGNTNGGGINFWANSGKNFQHIKASPKNPDGLSFNHVTAFWERADGNIWIGTDGGGLNFYHRKSNRYIAFRNQATNPESLGGDKVLTVIEDRKGNVWVGGWGGGLSRFKPNYSTDGMPAANATFTNYMPSARAGSLSSPNVTGVLEDLSGNIWVGHGYGLDRYNPDDDSFTNFREQAENPNSLADNGVWAMYVDRAGNLWVGTRDGGLNLFNHETQTFTRYMHDEDDPGSLSHNYIWTIFEDSKNRLWVGTQGGGLNLFDRATETFEHIREQDGLPSDVIVSIEEDAKGRLWIGTSNGLSRYDHEKKEIRNYTLGEGLQGAKFARMSSLHSQSGELFFGGVNGFNRFYPDSIQDNAFIPPVMITDFQLFNKSVKIGDEGSPLSQSILQTTHLSLTHQQSVFNLVFAALNYINPEENEYKFMLEGFDEAWREIGTERSTTYTNLGAGNYEFKVKASNNDGIWNEVGKSLEIEILPPPWLSWWAFLLYAVAAIAIVWLARQQLIQREKLKSNLRLKALEAKNLQEIDQVKSKFFANISHELRTPLTVILGMTQDVLDKIPQISWPQIERKLHLVRRNGSNLLQLVNQMLDLAKLESNTIQLKWVKGDIIRYINYLIESFHSYAESRQIRFQFDNKVGALEMDYDADRIRDILSNLLSNAVKFTPEGGRVTVSCELENLVPLIPHQQSAEEETAASERRLLLTVSDTGIGISEDQLPRIFDRFYQVDDSSTRKSEGTGIGLALTYELVKLLGGDIQVSSEKGKGTTFSIWLPVKQQAIDAAADWEQDFSGIVTPQLEADPTLPAMTSGLDGEEHPLLLIVEDNTDVVEYLKSCLEEDYRLAVAGNGIEGIEKAIELIPDIIICDVMMPVKDGYEVCKTLKQDERSSHIPIIMLTAKASMEDKLTGLERGADAYLVKPFNKQELFIRLRKLIALRRQLQTRYATLEVPSIIANNQSNQIEDNFLRKVRRIVEEFLDDANFDVGKLAEEVAMSRSQLHRKLKALTGRSSTQYIRGLRMQKAKHLLLHTKMSMADVAYTVGFSDPNYFSRSFVKEFEMRPTDLRD